MVLVLVVGFYFLLSLKHSVGKQLGLLMRVLVNWYRNREVNFKNELQYVPPSLSRFPSTL